MSLRTILLVDGNQHERERVAVALRKEIDCVVLEADNPEKALEILEREQISLLLTEMFLPAKDGMELIKKIPKINAEALSMAVIPRNHGDLEVEALKLGAFFYIHTPYDFSEAVIGASRALRFYDLKIHGEMRGVQTRKKDGFFGIIGKAPAMENLYRIVEKVAADAESTVLLYGESGTGKELFARAVHGLSPRRGKNLVPVNCAAIPDELLESELFGYVKGAFTGAVQAKIGRIQYADGGTLFLDEIGDMKPNLQAKLLRVLQEREFEPVGAIKSTPVDVRVVAATHRNLEKLVHEGKFREDLYYRLNVVPLVIPPLRERLQDIPELVDQFILCFSRNRNTGGPTRFDDLVIQSLMDYHWPGNVRELKNLVQQMVVLYGGETITLDQLPGKYISAGKKARGSSGFQPAENPFPPAPRPFDELMGGAVDFNTLVSEFEDRLILQALNRTGGNKKEAAELLNLKRTTLLEKIKKKGIDDKADF
ncbi:MAG: sigma-54-dependent Fis family transcriptional regulator [Deltaproteobacteria bacterium]|nr:sigma-54-dependent Fis family transcriptional regulator [Deltaproteobacteria bacterium]